MYSSSCAKVKSDCCASEPSPAILRLDCRGRERPVGGADGSGAGGCGALRGARRARRRLNTNIKKKVPCLKGMRGKSRPFSGLGIRKRGACAPAGGGTGPGPRRARAEPRAAGGSAGAAGLAVSERLGQRAWARGGPGSRQGEAGQGPARPGGLPKSTNPTSVYVRTSLREEERSLLARRWPLRQRGSAQVTTLY